MGANVRPSKIAGQWYEGEPKVLERKVDSYIEAAQLPVLDGEVVAVVAPHAGHLYSGPVAGYAFAALKELKPEVVAVLSPFHNFHNAPLLTSLHDAYGTPLGIVPIERGLVDELSELMRAEVGFGLTGIANDGEHSLEIELPFLQRALAGAWKLLPVMVRAQDKHVCQTLGKLLARVLTGQHAIMVASTDLSHYYDQKTAIALDRAMLEQVEAFDPERAFDVERSGRGYACGLGALTAVLWAAREMGADHVQVLRYATSGDATGDYNAVVGYGAAVILKSHKA
jgi:MEMO1 family protein